MAARKSAGMQALAEIARHEKECGERWKDAHRELQNLSKDVKTHAARWEKMAWLVVTTVVAGFLATVLKTFL